MNIDLLTFCPNDALFPQTGPATARPLEPVGHTVRVPTLQTCCGQIHSNAGYQKGALPPGVAVGTSSLTQQAMLPGQRLKGRSR